MKRTTIMADEGLLLEAQQLAAQRGVTFTAIVHEALRAYLGANRSQHRLSFIGIGHSGDRYPADAESGWEETILGAGGEPTEGWPRSSACEGQHEKQNVHAP